MWRSLRYGHYPNHYYDSACSYFSRCIWIFWSLLSTPTCWSLSTVYGPGMLAAEGDVSWCVTCEVCVCGSMGGIGRTTACVCWNVRVPCVDGIAAGVGWITAYGCWTIVIATLLFVDYDHLYFRGKLVLLEWWKNQKAIIICLNSVVELFMTVLQSCTFLLKLIILSHLALSSIVQPCCIAIDFFYWNLWKYEYIYSNKNK